MQDGCSTAVPGHHPRFSLPFFHVSSILNILNSSGDAWNVRETPGFCTARLAKALDSISLIPGFLCFPGAERLKIPPDVNRGTEREPKGISGTIQSET